MEEIRAVKRDLEELRTTGQQSFTHPLMPEYRRREKEIEWHEKITRLEDKLESLIKEKKSEPRGIVTLARVKGLRAFFERNTGKRAKESPYAWWLETMLVIAEKVISELQEELEMLMGDKTPIEVEFSPWLVETENENGELERLPFSIEGWI